jgi:hypothetical protein
MGTFDAGSLKSLNGTADTELVYRTTVHGPIVGYATSDGKKVAISMQRSTRGRELLGAIPFQTLSTGGVHSPEQFFKTMSGFELTFNWFYADSKHIATYSSGRLPLRAAVSTRDCRRTGTVRTSGAGGSTRIRIRTSSILRAGRSSTGTTSRRPRSPRRTTTGRTDPCTASSCCRTRCRRIASRRLPSSKR